jgi:hypothetical protein
MTYSQEFSEALKRTARLGLITPNFSPQIGNMFLTPANGEAISEAIYASAGALTKTQIIAQCIAINLQLAPAIEKALGCPAFLTIGHVNISGDSYFERTESDLLEMIENAAPKKSVPLHCWLTLPSHEVIDLTFRFSMKHINGWKECSTDPIAGDPDHLGDVRYHPMLVGHDFIAKAKLASVANVI